MKQKFKLIAIDGSIVETFGSFCAAEMFRSYYYKLCGELLDIERVKNE